MNGKRRAVISQMRRVPHVFAGVIIQAVPASVCPYAPKKRFLINQSGWLRH